jgi:hypothetical protein
LRAVAAFLLLLNLCFGFEVVLSGSSSGDVARSVALDEVMAFRESKTLVVLEHVLDVAV